MSENQGSPQQQQGGAGVPYLGSKISLISKAEIRYEGTLYTIDPQEATVALAKVRSFGTEDRPTDRPVAARNEIFEFIIFRGQDIKDLNVCEPPQPQPTEGVPLDPAIVRSSQPPPNPVGATYTASSSGQPPGQLYQPSVQPLYYEQQSEFSVQPSQGQHQQPSQGQQQQPSQGQHQQPSQGQQQQPSQGQQQQPPQGQHQQPTQGKHQQPTQGKHQQPTQGQHLQSSQGQHLQSSQGQNQQLSQSQQPQGQRQQPSQGHYQQPSQGQQKQPSQGQHQQPSQGQQKQPSQGQHQQPSQGQHQQSSQGQQKQPSQGQHQQPSQGQHQQPPQGLQQQPSQDQHLHSGSTKEPSTKVGHSSEPGNVTPPGASYASRPVASSQISAPPFSGKAVSNHNAQVQLSSPENTSHNHHRSNQQQHHPQYHGQGARRVGGYHQNSNVDNRGRDERAPQASYSRERNSSRVLVRGGSNRGGQWGVASGGHHQSGRQAEPLKFDTEFDFESSNAQFAKDSIDKELKNLSLGDRPVGGEEEEPEEEADDSEVIEEEPVYYNKAKSFFDNISCDATDTFKGQRFSWKEGRKLNSETFGIRENFRRNYRGRGSWRGGVDHGGWGGGGGQGGGRWRGEGGYGDGGWNNRGRGGFNREGGGRYYGGNAGANGQGRRAWGYDDRGQKDSHPRVDVRS